jgi:hypothetical protein
MSHCATSPIGSELAWSHCRNWLVVAPEATPVFSVAQTPVLK